MRQDFCATIGTLWRVNTEQACGVRGSLLVLPHELDDLLALLGLESSAIEMMAVDPIQRVVVPRFLGGVIAMPLLAAIFSLIPCRRTNRIA